MLEHHTELGAGYRIALKDLELRGAGNLLGAEQSGHAQAVGLRSLHALAGGDGAVAPGPGHDRAAGAAGRGARPAGPPARRLRAGRRRRSWTSTGDWRGPRRLATLMGCEMNCASASGRCRPRPRRCSTWRGSASWERCSAFSTCWCAATRPGSRIRAGTHPAARRSDLGAGRRAARRRSAADGAALAPAAAAGRRADRARTGARAQGGGEVTLSGDVMRRNVILAAVLAHRPRRLRAASATSSRRTPTWPRRRAASSSRRSGSRRS